MAATPDNKPTLHHLNNSQSQRILWLLEELEIPYNLELHNRNAANDPNGPFRSPPSLTSIGKYGKAPLLVTGPADGSRIIPETQAIATYLLRTFPSAFAGPHDDWVRDEMLCSVIQTSLSRATFTLLMLDFRILKNGASTMFDGPELRKALGDVQRELVDGGAEYLMGARPGRADFLLEFPLSSVRHRGSVDLKAEFPALDAWLDRVYERPAWKRALAKGNGYDLSVFPKLPHE
ncbi:glutathione s-transferase [Phlyctema vagabunda]|uniref:Glutathione s-transferase n=1 Tax=Phlyctema vagabunda TaxID=108571 RepID=A0ABR4P8X0_9HELO